MCDQTLLWMRLRFYGNTWKWFNCAYFVFNELFFSTYRRQCIQWINGVFICHWIYSFEGMPHSTVVIWCTVLFYTVNYTGENCAKWLTLTPFRRAFCAGFLQRGAHSVYLLMCEHMHFQLINMPHILVTIQLGNISFNCLDCEMYASICEKFTNGACTWKMMRLSY